MMRSFDYEDDVPKKRNFGEALLNILTVIMLLLTLCIITSFVLIYTQPNSIFNPFPPVTMPAPQAMPTATATSINSLPATWTITPSPAPTASETPRPFPTIPPSPTYFSLLPGTPTPESTKPPGGYQYVLKGDHPLAIPNIAHSDVACNWMGVAGQVEDISGGPKTQLIVVLGGTLEGKLVDPTGVKYTLTGVAPLYGQAGYEFVLADKPTKSTGTLWVQLMDQANTPLSDRVYFDTFDVCEKNLIVVSFKQIR
jgi:hypothetical protein